MRIAFFHATLPEPGRKLAGVEVVVHALASALARTSDCEVLVLSTGPAPAGSPYEHRRVQVPPVLGRGRSARLITLPVALNAVDLTGVDALHLHGDDWFFLRRRTATVRTMHGSALREAQTAKTWSRRGLQYAVYPLERLSARLADLTLAVGPDAAGLYPGAVLIDNGVDTSVFRSGRKAAAPTVLFVGGWSNRKRGHLVQRAFTEQVLPRLPAAQLVMVADHAEPAPGVTLVPHPSDADLAELYRSAWIFACPSEYEGFGLPYLEAMASGTAVLATPNSGADHVLEQGRSGRIVADQAFAAELLHLLQDDGERARLEAAGRQRASALSWSRIAAVHLDLYAEAIDRHRARSHPRVRGTTRT